MNVKNGFKVNRFILVDLGRTSLSFQNVLVFDCHVESAKSTKLTSSMDFLLTEY